MYNRFMLPIIVLTSDKRNWLLRGFIKQWQRYGGGLPVTIAGFTRPEFDLPLHFDFHSIGAFDQYPVDRWTNALMDLFDQLRYEKTILLLEDYWLFRPVVLEALHWAEQFMEQHVDCVRFCLTTDRLNCGNIQNFENFHGLSVFEAGQSPYQLSFQASAWRIGLLFNALQRNWTPWQAEMKGSAWMDAHPEYRVFGSRQWPIPYQIMVRNGEFVEKGDWMYPVRQLCPEDMAEIKKLGFDHP